MHRLVAVICTVLVLVLSIILFGVSISIVAKFGRYGDVLRPERGLGGFNIAIAILGFIIGGFGLFSVLTNRKNLSEIVAYVSIVLALFTFASLIAALIINSLAIDYVNNRILSHLNRYTTDRDSRVIIDKMQTNYDCCGAVTWLDWSAVAINTTTTTNQTTTTTTPASPSNETTTVTTAPSSNETTTIITTNNTTTTPAGETTTTSVSETITTPAGQTTTTPAGQTTTTPAGQTTTTPAGQTTTTTAGETTTIAAGGEETTTATNETSVRKRIKRLLFGEKPDKWATSKSADGDNMLSGLFLTNSVDEQTFVQPFTRRKRQTQSSYGGIYGLPTSFSVVLPQSCCTTDYSSIGDLNSLYCISNDTNSIDTFHTQGCAKPVSKQSIGQTLGLVVLDSFLFLLTLACIPLLYHFKYEDMPSQDSNAHQPTSSYYKDQQSYYDYGNQGYSAPTYDYGYGGSANNYGYSAPTYDYGYGASAYDQGMLYKSYNPTYASYNYNPGYGY